MFRLWKAYQTALTINPTRTAMITTGGLMALGDVCAQTFVEKRNLSQFDLKRTGRFMIFGTFLGGPMFSQWYRLLARTFEGKKYAQVKMVACDQLAFAPPFLAFFLVTMEVMKGEKINNIKLKMKQDFPEVMDTNYKVWPAVQLCNFTFIQADYRILIINLVSVFWNTYLAWLAERNPGNKPTVYHPTYNKSAIDIGEHDYPEVLKTNYKIWPAVQAVNFTFVPLHLRIVTVNLVAIFWNTYLAWMSEKSHEEEPSEEQSHIE